MTFAQGSAVARTYLAFHHNAKLYKLSTVVLAIKPFSALEEANKLLFKKGTDDDFAVVTGKTIFHPQGGGQPSDEGVITKGGDAVFRVSMVRMDAVNDGQVLHFGRFDSPSSANSKFQVGETVETTLTQTLFKTHMRLRFLVNSLVVTWQSGDKRRASASDGHHNQQGEVHSQQSRQRPRNQNGHIVKLPSAGRQMSEPTHPTSSSAFENNEQIPQALTTPTFQRQQLSITLAAPELATVSENEQAQQAFRQWAAYSQALSSMAAQVGNGQYLAYIDMSSYNGSSWGQQASPAVSHQGIVANYGNIYQAYAPGSDTNLAPLSKHAGQDS